MILCCIVRCITDFSMWSPIVVSITISSMFFAIEDLFSSISKMYGRLNKIRAQGVSDLKYKFQQDVEAESRVTKVYEENKDIAPELKTLFTHFEKVQSYNEEIETLITSLERDNEKSKKTYKVCHITSIIFSFLGFLLLFASMILVSFVDVSIKTQELITVLSFAIILATSQISSSAAENVKKEEDATAHVLKSYDNAITSTQELESNIYETIALIRGQKRIETEDEIVDAD